MEGDNFVGKSKKFLKPGGVENEVNVGIFISCTKWTDGSLCNFVSLLRKCYFKRPCRALEAALTAIISAIKNCASLQLFYSHTGWFKLETDKSGSSCVWCVNTPASKPILFREPSV